MKLYNLSRDFAQDLNKVFGTSEPNPGSTLEDPRAKALWLYEKSLEDTNISPYLNRWEMKEEDPFPPTFYFIRGPEQYVVAFTPFLGMWISSSFQ